MEEVNNYKEALIAGATEEAKWDGRTFEGLSKGEKQRYVDRFEAGLFEYFNVRQMKFIDLSTLSEIDKAIGNIINE